MYEIHNLLSFVHITRVGVIWSFDYHVKTICLYL